MRCFAPQFCQLARKYGIEKVYVFGSVARGEATAGSDVDLMVEMEPGVSLLGAARFGYKCEKLLGVRVDVVPRSTFAEPHDKAFVEVIQREAVAI